MSAPDFTLPTQSVCITAHLRRLQMCPRERLEFVAIQPGASAENAIISLSCDGTTLQILIPSGSTLKVDVISQDEYEAHQLEQCERADEIKAEGY